MGVLLIIAGILFIILGLSIVVKPKKANERRDKYRIKENREYTDTAEGQAVMGGLLFVAVGVALIIVQVILGIIL